MALLILEKMIFAMEFAHEYTHLLQIQNPIEIKNLKKMSKEDKEYMELIAGLCDSIFTIFDGVMQWDFVQGAFTSQDAQLSAQYRKIVPRKINTDKFKVISTSKFKTENDFKQSVNLSFDEAFFQILKNLPYYTDEQILPNLKERLCSIVQDKEKIIQLYNDVKTYCCSSARKEKEAYSVESTLAKDIFGTKDNLNIDAMIYYYASIENALRIK